MHASSGEARVGDVETQIGNRSAASPGRAIFGRVDDCRVAYCMFANKIVCLRTDAGRAFVNELR